MARTLPGWRRRRDQLYSRHPGWYLLLLVVTKGQCYFCSFFVAHCHQFNRSMGTGGRVEYRVLCPLEFRESGSMPLNVDYYCYSERKGNQTPIAENQREYQLSRKSVENSPPQSTRQSHRSVSVPHSSVVHVRVENRERKERARSTGQDRPGLLLRL